MPKKCCVSNCKVQQDDPEGLHLSFYKLPADENVKKQWLESIKQHCDIDLKKYSYVCSRHFEKKCFDMTCSGLKNGKLKKGSCPTIFVNSKNLKLFPKDANVRESWRVFCNNKRNWVPTRSSAICSDHFKSSDFQTLPNNRRKLTPGAIPSLLASCLCSYHPTLNPVVTNDVSPNIAPLSPIEESNASNLPSTSRNSECILPSTTRCAPTTKPKTQKPSASTSCEQEKKTKVYSLLPIIAKVYLYLEKEYEYIKTLNGNNCDLSPLEDILRRTSEATGVSEEDVISILDAEGLSDHLPSRARSKRRKILQCSTENDRENDDLIEDDDILQEENDNVTVKLEITEDTEIQHGLIHSSCNMDYSTPATDLTQVKSEPQEIAYPHTDSIRYLEVTPLTSTSGSNNSVEYTIQTRVKLEQEEDESMTDNLLLPNRPGSNNSVEDTTQTRVKLECEEDETTTDTLVQPKSNPSNEPATLEPADTAIKLQPEDID